MRATPAEAVPPTIRVFSLLFLLASMVFVASCADNETAIVRGDRLWADSSLTGALAEYRLAAVQRGDDEALSRLAHALAMAGELNDARDVYRELLKRSPDFRDQAVFDFIHLARRASRRGDAYGAAVAMDAALAIRPEVQLPRATAEAATFYNDRGDADLALAYYRRTLAGVEADSTPPILYEMGRLEEERGRCDVATDYFNALREQAEGSSRWRELLSESSWHIGSCALRLAREARAEERPGEALAHLDTLIRLGVPENLLDQAWFERGELLLERGSYDEALAAYRQVLERNPARTGQLVERTQRRIDEIRFGPLPSDTAGGPRRSRDG